MGGTAVNVLKSRKRYDEGLTTPQMPLKRTQPVRGTLLQEASHPKEKISIQAQRSLSLDVEPVNCGTQRSILRQPSVPPRNDVENYCIQSSSSRQLPLPLCDKVENSSKQRSVSASNLSFGQRSNPWVSPRRHSQLARNECDSTPLRCPRRHTQLARTEHASTPRRSPRFSCRQQTQLDDNEHVSPDLCHR
ncbi:hypothetical protein MKX01_042547, partial [Papaver californicum]